MTFSGFGSRGGGFAGTNSSTRSGFGSGGSVYKGRSDNNNDSNEKTSTNVDFSQLPPIKRDFYKEHPDVAALTPVQVTAFRTTHSMHIIGQNVPKPISKFDHAEWGSVEIQKRLQKEGFAEPTPIQAQGWPMALSGRNMVGIAQTGSGKTLSYVLPGLRHVLGAERLNSTDPVALVLAPTRELACQIQEVARVYGNTVGIRNACVYGGVPKGDQIRTLRRGVEMIIATPGRLLDFHDAKLVNLQAISFLVLDEADRMLDMGFEPQIRRILGCIRPDRQVLLWSATWPKGVQRLAYDMLGRDFIQVNIGNSADQSVTANKRIKQHIILVNEHEKEEELVKLLNSIYEHGPEANLISSGGAVTQKKDTNEQKTLPRIIVFTNKKRIADDLANKAYQDGWPVDALHGDKLQHERDAILARFKSGEVPILIATDVAARGLDVKDVRVVVNYDMPPDIEDYVHRIGRTARGSDERLGCAYAFFDPIQNKGLARNLVGLLDKAEQPVPDSLKGLVPIRKGFGGSDGYNKYSRYNSGNGNRRGYGGGYGGRGGHGNRNHNRNFAPY